MMHFRPPYVTWPPFSGAVMSLSRRSRYFELEFSRRHRSYFAPARLGLIGLCVVLAIGIAWSIFEAADWMFEGEMVRSRLDQVRDQDRQLMSAALQEGIDVSPESLLRLPAEVALANQMLGKRNFSWTRFLSGLEAAIPSNVAIKSVRLDSTSAVVHLTGSAVSVGDVTALALKMQHHPIFRDPVLGQHRVGSDGLVEFDLTLKYHQGGA